MADRAGTAATLKVSGVSARLPDGRWGGQQPSGKPARAWIPARAPRGAPSRTGCLNPWKSGAPRSQTSRATALNAVAEWPPPVDVWGGQRPSAKPAPAWSPAEAPPASPSRTGCLNPWKSGPPAQPAFQGDGTECGRRMVAPPTTPAAASARLPSPPALGAPLRPPAPRHRGRAASIPGNLEPRAASLPGRRH